MPLNKSMNHSEMVKELIKNYKEDGKIGNTTPRDMKHALEIANAIAYSEKGDGAKTEALEIYIRSLIRPENKAFIEGVVLEGLKICMESELEDPRKMMGRTFQYDRKAGKYYEPSADRHLEYDDFSDVENADQDAQRKYQARIKAGIENAKSAKDINHLINAKNLYWDSTSARKAEALAMKLTGDMDPSLADRIIKDDSSMFEADDAIPLIGSKDEISNEAPKPDQLASINPSALTQEETNAIKVQMDETQAAKDKANATISNLTTAIKDATNTGDYEKVTQTTDEMNYQIKDFNEKANKLKASAAETSVNKIS
jgi:hypothetical protein